MIYDLNTLNRLISSDPTGYIAGCEKFFNSRVRKAADEIVNNLDQSPIVLLSGPSASGKTTTSKKLTTELKALGLNAITISLDNYFLTVDPETAPRTQTGELDRESPACLDTRLLNRHFHMLAAGKEIQIPHFDFARQKRDPDRHTPARLGKNDIAVFEGIHALNDSFTAEHPKAYRLYVSTMSDITDKGKILISSTTLRLIRRIVRDDYFRGADPSLTLEMWENIRRGELANILPYRDSANMSIDSALPYETAVMKQFAGSVFDKIPRETTHFDVLQQVLGAFSRFETIDPALVPSNSILREFIGGSIFEY